MISNSAVTSSGLDGCDPEAVPVEGHTIRRAETRSQPARA